MKQELDKKLCEDFPNLFADRSGDMQNTAMCWGFECGDGWFQLIYDLAQKLEPLCLQEKSKMTAEQLQWYGGGPRASQVKEKFGTLRFYMTLETEEMSKLIQEAEEKSSVTCEQCGEPGELRGKFWLYTACHKHTKEQDLIVSEDRN